MATKFNREAAADYAQKHALHYNPTWPSYTSQNGGGGDCTNFVSQCVLAGGWRMVNYSPGNSGPWYCYTQGQLAYNKVSDSWASANWFTRFLGNSGRAVTCRRDELQLADVIILTRGGRGVHVMIVSQVAHAMMAVPQMFRDVPVPGQSSSFPDPGPVPAGSKSYFLSYHSTDTLNISLEDAEKKFTGSAYDGVIYWHLLDYPPG